MSSTTHDIILHVPFYSQLDDAHKLGDYWKTRSCGILALKMVVDYWRHKQGLEPIPAADLLAEGDVMGGRNDEGWLHSTIVMVARHYGFIAWRRGWMLSSDGLRRFSAEGARDRTLGIVDDQQRKEAFPTLVDSIERGYPVIVSVARNFAEVDKPHMIVLTGIRRTNEKGDYHGFFYNDPYSPTRNERKDRYVSLAHFTDKWRWQGIFVMPEPE